MFTPDINAQGRVTIVKLDENTRRVVISHNCNDSTLMRYLVMMATHMPGSEPHEFVRNMVISLEHVGKSSFIYTTDATIDITNALAQSMIDGLIADCRQRGVVIHDSLENGGEDSTLN